MTTSQPQDGQESFYNDTPSDVESADNNYQIDLLSNNLPQPWIVNPENRRRALERNYRTEVKLTERLLGRSLTRIEQEAMAYWSNREVQITSRGPIFGSIAGFYRAYATRKTFNFPFYKPGETFNPNAVSLGPVSILKGTAARAFWHFWRTTAYGVIIGPIIVGLFTRSWGVSVASAGRRRDPRIAPIFVMFQERARQEMIERSRQMQGGNREGQSDNASPGRNDDRDEYAPTSSQQQANAANAQPFEADRPSFDPYSPQQSTESTSNSSSPADYTYGSQITSQNPPSYGQRPSQPYPGAQPKQDPYRPPPPPQSDNQGSSFFDDGYDDASPTAQYPSSSPQASRGSSWDRIRAGTAPPNSRGSGPLSGSSTDSRSQPYSSFGSDNSSGKSQAELQKEFDEKLEKERRGRGFD